MTDSIIRIIARIIISVGLLKKMIIVRMDGGICSQIHFYIVGQYFVKKGYRVKYDLQWFENCGKDLTGQFARNFDLQKAFTYIQLEKSNKIENYFYRRLAHIDNATFKDVTPPAYLGGYYDDDDNNTYSTILPSLFHIRSDVFDKDNLVLYQEITANANTVAIHVRRGDLAIFNGAYGEPVTSLYFIHAINYIEKKESGRLKCYLFSDEPAWVEKNLLPLLPASNEYKVVTKNGSDKGYMDLFLISACKYQITSKGSFGKYGGFLNTSSGGKIIVFDDRIEREKWSNKHTKIVFIK